MSARRRARALACTLGATVAVAALGGCSGGGPGDAAHPSDATGLGSATAQPGAHRWVTADLITLARGSGGPLDAKLAEGDAAWQQGDATRAELAFRQAALLDPNDPAPIVGGARAKLARADVPEGVNTAPGDPTLMAVIEELRRAVMLDAAYAPARLELGRALLMQGDAEAARAELRTTVGQAPESAEAHSALGLAELALGDTGEALASLGRATMLEPGRAARHANLGTALLMAGKAVDAVTSFERATALDPADDQALSSLGAALLAAGRTADALRVLERAVAQAPAVAAHRANLGHALELAGELDRAVEELQQAVRLDPELTSALLNLGNALAELGRWDEARQAHDRARTLEPEDPTVRAAIEDRERLQAERAKPPSPPKAP